MIRDDLVQAVLSLLIVGAALAYVRSTADVRRLYLATIAVATAMLAWPIVGLFVVSYTDVFWVLRMWCWGGFVWGPAWMLMAAMLAFRRGSRASAAAFLVAVLALTGIGLDAFVREPHALVETHYTLVSDEITRPTRIAIVADWQTDNIGPYERYVADRVLAGAPDLVLFAGDYVQEWDEGEYGRVAAAFHGMLREIDFAPPLGIYAVQGNMESARPGRWMELFRDTRVQATEETRTWRAGDLSITALSFDDSFDTRLVLPSQQGFHVVVGHGPDFFLGTSDADLLVAGHTHGGQVQIPGFGPPFTLSQVPRDWAAGGMFQLPSGPMGVVSRGIGMERALAPRLRFWCRPELVFVDVFPGSPPLATDPFGR